MGLGLGGRHGLGLSLGLLLLGLGLLGRGTGMGRQDGLLLLRRLRRQSPVKPPRQLGGPDGQIG